MSLKSPQKTLNMIRAMMDADTGRSENRVLIQRLFNGNPPYTTEEAEKLKAQTNISFLEGVRIMNGARSQFASALLKPGNFFDVSVDFGPEHKRVAWGNIITKEVNRIMKRSRAYRDAIESQVGNICLHGVGPVTWLRDRDWCPKPHAIEDVLVPTNTLQSLENLTHFAVHVAFTLQDLMRMTRLDKTGWNMPLVNAILKSLGKMEDDAVSTQTTSDPYLFPEKVEEDLKENAIYYGSDAVPVCWVWDFYYLDASCECGPSWKRRILVDQTQQGLPTASAMNEWLYDPGDRCHGKDVSQIMHVQFADGAVKPPFRWHSTRSLGYLLYGVCHLQDRLRCRFTDSVFEQMLWMFRVRSEEDQEAVRKVDLGHMGIVPDGLTWVSPSERQQIDVNLMTQGFAMNRQNMAESAAQFQTDVNDGTRKEMTATEVMARANASNALMGSMLSRAYTIAEDQYREILRRFFTIDHEDCKRFRQRCEAQGVDPVCWERIDDMDVMAERAVGSGNKMLEMAAAEKLMAVRPMLSPIAQQVVLHMYVEANTDNAGLAQRLVPLEDSGPSRAVERATLAWGTLWTGQPVVIADTINRVEYVGTLLQMLNAQLQKTEQQGGMPQPQDVSGMMNVMQHIQQEASRLQGDDSMEPFVRQVGDALKNAGNLVKGYMQRIEEAQMAQAEAQGGDADPKVQAMLLQAETKARIQEANAEQKRAQREAQFVADQRRKDAAVLGEAQRSGARVQAEIAATDLRAAADIQRGSQQQDNE
jgi:hypothetical protein